MSALKVYLPGLTVADGWSSGRSGASACEVCPCMVYEGYPGVSTKQDLYLRLTVRLGVTPSQLTVCIKSFSYSLYDMSVICTSAKLLLLTVVTGKKNCWSVCRAFSFSLATWCLLGKVSARILCSVKGPFFSTPSCLLRSMTKVLVFLSSSLWLWSRQSDSVTMLACSFSSLRQAGAWELLIRLSRPSISVDFSFDAVISAISPVIWRENGDPSLFYDNFEHLYTCTDIGRLVKVIS